MSTRGIDTFALYGPGDVLTAARGTWQVTTRWAGRYRERQRTRATLLALGADSLADVGLTRAQARAEGRRPFWQA